MRCKINDLYFIYIIFKVHTTIVSGEYNLDGVRSIEWGVTHESTALNHYSEAMSVTVQATGVWLSADGKLGASPDGLVGDNICVEVKCPYKYRDSTLAEAVTNSDFFLHLVNGQYDMKTDHDYYHQIQGALHFTDRTVIHLVVWTTKECTIVIMEKDVEWAILNIPKLLSFYDEFILPKIVSSE